MTTKFEAQFFCQLPNSDDIIYMGRYGHSTNKSMEEIETGKADELIQYLFHQLPTFNPTVPFKPDNNTKYCIWFERNNDNELLIYLFSGNQEPEPKILSLKRGISSRDGNDFYFYTFNLSMGSQFYANDKKLFLMLLNNLMEKINIDEYNNFIKGKHYLRFFFSQELPHLPPVVKAYFREIEYAIPDHQQALNLCPSDRLPCEINTLYLGHFVFIPKQKWLNKDNFCLDDLMGGD